MEAKTLVDELVSRNFNHFTGVPCSIVKPLINFIIDSEKCDYLPATIEGEAMAIASGAYMAGVDYALFMQNSGLGNIVNTYTSLTALYKMPLLLFVTWRGEAGIKDAPQHKMMGEKTLALLETLDIDYEVLEDNTDHVKKVLNRAQKTIREDKKSFAVVLKKGLIDSYDLKSNVNYKKESSFEATSVGENKDLPSREEVCSYLSKETKGSPVICSTGFTSRQFFNEEDRDSNFYMQGSMGYTLSIGLGVSINHDKRVFVIDGDGSLLMHPGGLLTAGVFCKGNLTYILLDNGVHDSTGGQSTISANVKFDKLAESAGFERYISVNDVERLPDALNLAKEAVSFIHVRTKAGKGSNMKRPHMELHEITSRFMRFLKESR